MENVHKMFIQQLNNATFTYHTVDKRIKEMKERGYNHEEKYADNTLRQMRTLERFR